MNSSFAPLRCAVVGANRGQTFIEAAKRQAGQVELVALCDTNPDALLKWQNEDGIRCYHDYQQLLDDENVDVVCIATPVPLHARQAILALESGKHVLSEVTAAYTMDECWDLVEAVERTKKTYMMAENYCYMRENLLLQNMVEQGVFGDITYASGAYLHDCRELLWNENEELTWRGDLRGKYYGNTYPTHSLGPVSRWLGIGKTDRYKTTATWGTRSLAIPDFAARNFPHRPEYFAPGAFPGNDNAITMLKTEKGIVVEIRVDWASPRPHNMARHELQGTRASYTTQEPGRESLIWIEGRSETNSKGVAGKWEAVSNYYQEFEHPLWREHLLDAEKAGHGGGDFFVLREFAAAIREERAPMIDVYDAVTWSCITPLSMKSIDENNGAVEVPDFKKPRRVF